MEVEIQTFSLDFDRCFSKRPEDADADARSRSLHLTRTLTKLKKEFVPRFISDSNFLDGRDSEHRRDGLSMVAGDGNGNGNGNGNGETNSFSLVGSLFFVVNDNRHDDDDDDDRSNHDENQVWFPTTEGHREMGCEILKSMFGGSRLLPHSFGRHDSKAHDVQGSSSRRRQLEFHRERIRLFHRWSVVFRNRMSRHANCTKSSGGGGGKYAGGLRLSSQTKGSMTEPVEASEYIRLLLAELAVDLADRLIDAGISLGDVVRSPGSIDVDNDDEEPSERCMPRQGHCQFRDSQQLLLRASCNFCSTLAKSSLLDPYPEVQRTCCLLIEKLARLCPLGVRMNGLGLLSPLTGMAKDATVPGTMSGISKHCLFRHRHAKTRSKAVDASVAIVMCCPTEAPTNGHVGDGSGGDGNELLPDVQRIQLEYDRMACVSSAMVSDRGSHASTLERVLNDVLLVGWQDLLFLDTSAAVRISVVNALERVSNGITWRSRPVPVRSVGDEDGTADRARATDVSFHVGAKALSLLILGLSDGVDPVQTAASRVLCSLSNGDIADNSGNRYHNDLQSRLPLRLFFIYFHTILELLLDDCSYNWTICQSRVRSLEALQTFLSLASSLFAPDERRKINESKGVMMSKLSMLRIIDVLIEGILSDEKNVLEAALSCCQSVGNCDTYSDLVLECLTSTTNSTKKDASATVEVKGTEREVNDSLDIKETCKLGPSLVTLSSPRQMIAILLLLDGMMKGCVSNEARASVPKRVDPEILTNKPTWFKSKSTMEAISSMLCHATVVNNVTTHSSLAWALLDACSSFTKCIETFQCNLGEEITTRILLSLVYLLGCPEEFGSKSANAGDVDESSQPSQEKTAEEYSLRISLMSLLQAILSDGSFDDAIETLSPIHSMISKNFTTDILLSLVLPNLVWRSGGLAAALRKLSAATMFSLLSYHKTRPRRDTDAESNIHKPDTLLHLIPILHSNLEDTESTTRELCCHCLSLVLEQVSRFCFQSMWEADTRVVDTLYPKLLALLDDSHDPVRMAACTALQHFLRLACDITSCEASPTCRLGFSSLEEIASGLIIQLDDPDAEIRHEVLKVLTTLLDLQRIDSSSNENIAQTIEMKRKVIGMIDSKVRAALKSHRHTQLCRSLLENVEEIKKEMN
ncbi:hypothetical protein ACHAXS_003673 [Conticribra weissflogii]